MKKIKLLFVFGTRPEAIKMAPVILQAKSDPRFQPFVCLTAQHREMSDQVLTLFRIKPDFDLNIMRKNQTLDQITHLLFTRISPIFNSVKPSIVLVQGDTTTAFAVALKAFYQKIPLAHIEAGLRSFNKLHPFPEEINRVLISHLSDLHFAPTKEAAANLSQEGIKQKNIFVTGNTIVDALHLISSRTKNVRGDIDLSRFSNKKMILITTHRRENFGRPIEDICQALLAIAKKHKDCYIVYPVHLNPKVRNTAIRFLSNHPSILLLPPVRYSIFVKLMQQSYLILTDSGGVQEEAPSFNKPVLVMREVSERPDGIKLGLAKLVGTSKKKIVAEVSKLLSNEFFYKKMTLGKNPYGDGHASQRILDTLSRLIKP